MKTTAATTTAAVATPEITDPQGPQDFSKPITIRWHPKGTPHVTGWWLCVGTLETGVAEGDWNILSGDMRLNRYQTIDVSDQPHVKGLMVQLLCTVQDNEVDPSTGKRLDPPERTIVLDPMVIPNNKFASAFEAVASIADDQKKKTGGHHPMGQNKNMKSMRK
jgi:hypothetical protein